MKSAFMARIIRWMVIAGVALTASAIGVARDGTADNTRMELRLEDNTVSSKWIDFHFSIRNIRFVGSASPVESLTLEPCTTSQSWIFPLTLCSQSFLVPDDAQRLEYEQCLQIIPSSGEQLRRLGDTVTMPLFDTYSSFTCAVQIFDETTGAFITPRPTTNIPRGPVMWRTHTFQQLVPFNERSIEGHDLQELHGHRLRFYLHFLWFRENSHVSVAQVITPIGVQQILR